MNKINNEMLRKRRKELGMSQDDLAKKIGVSKVAVCWYENGERTPKYDVFIRIADVLGLTLNELSGMEVDVVSESGEPYGVKLSKQDIEIINEIKNHPRLYKDLYNDPVRTTKLIDKRMK